MSSSRGSEGMDSLQAHIQQTRREFLTSAASGGLGLAALATLFAQEGQLGLARADSNTDRDVANPLAPRPPHFAPRAKHCIFIFMDGGPSQLDLFDPKTRLQEYQGQQLPDSMLQNVRFAFIKKDAKLRASPRKFTRHGQCGMELSDLLPHLGACADDLCLIRTME